MIFKLTILFIFLHTAKTQDAACDYYQAVQPNRTYDIDSPNYPNYYQGGAKCRWIAICPTGYNCRLQCPEIRMPQSNSCSLDKLMVSRTGNPTLAAAESYCGVGSLDVVSTGQRISVGLTTNRASPGGRFRCQLTAQPITPFPSQCHCGERRQNRIVGGQETGVNEFKMMVGLVDQRIGKIKCGAVIISNRNVVTAGHCLYKQVVSDYAVMVGEHDVDEDQETPAARSYRINSFTVHPQYTESNFDYDIAVVRVRGKIAFNDRVGPVCLPFKFTNYNFTGSTVTILGWGTLSPGGPTSNTLQKVDVDVISQAACRTQVPQVTDRQVCTYTPGKDACQDDSGGPLLYTDPTTGLLFNVGIVSYGRSCASEFPAVNTRVTSLLNWIVRNTRTDYCVK